MTSSTVMKYKRHSTDMPLNVNTRVLRSQEYSRWSYRQLWIAFLAILYLALIGIFISCGFTLRIFLLGYSENVTIRGLSEFDSRQGYNFIFSPPHPGRVWDDGYRLDFSEFWLVVYFTAPAVSPTTDHCFERYNSWTKAETYIDNKEKTTR